MKNFKRAAAFCTCLALAASAMPPFAVFADGETENETVSSAYPASFDLRTQGLVTSVKDEGQFETSWAFSALNSIESDLIENNPSIDLSEWHLAYYTYSHNFGYPYSTEYLFNASTSSGEQETGILTSWIGPVSEDNAPMYGDMTIENSMLTMDQVRQQAEYHVTDAINYEYMVDENPDDIAFRGQRENLKKAIYAGNAIDASFLYLPDCFDNAYNSYYYSADKADAERPAEWHSISIVGWDDNFPATNFTSTPVIDGAWLCKDCHGTAYGDDGYFWLSYGEYDLDDIYEIHAESADLHNRLYQHDAFGNSGRYGYAPEGDTSVMAANIFTAAEDGWLTDVMFYNLNRGNNVEFTVYTNLTDEGNPTSGTASEVTAVSIQQLGYMSFTLTNPVQLHLGEKFAIVAKISGDFPEARIPVEFATKTEAIYDDGTNEAFDSAFTIEMLDRDFQPGQSFYSDNGQVWYDMHSIEPQVDEQDMTTVVQEGNVAVLSGTPSPEEEKSTEETPAEETPADAAPAEETPADAAPAEETPADAAPAEETPADAAPAEETPADAAPAEETPADAAPAEETPADAAPAEETPADAAPAEETPAEDGGTHKTLTRMVSTMKYGNICLKGVTRDCGTVVFSNYNELVEPGEKISLSNDDNAPIYYSLDGVDFQLYNAEEPIAFPEGKTTMTITAYADMDIVGRGGSKTKFTRTYTEKKAVMSSLLCKDGEYSDYAYKDIVDPSDLYYSIPVGTEQITVTPIATGTIRIGDDETVYTSGQTVTIALTDEIKSIPITVSKEGLASSDYTLHLTRYDVGEPISPGEVKLGDINQDGKVDAIDAADILIAAAAAGVGDDPGLTEAQIKAGDVNGDGVLGAPDATTVKMYAAAMGAGVEGVSVADFI